MKSYTDLKQSAQLALLLPAGSSDMWWSKNFIYYNPTAAIGISAEYSNVYTYKFGEDDIPCWSLAALLDQLEDVICDEDGNEWELVLKKENVQYDIYYLNICGEQDNIELDRFYDDLIDCCYEMILKLKEKDLL